MRVIVFGCGPAGLLAAYAAEREFGAKIIIISNKQKSQLYGCQYLHAAIPGLDLNAEMVQYTLNGSAETYRKKVYGSLRPPASVSPQLYEGSSLAWDIRQMYDILWERFEESIIDNRINPQEVISILDWFSADAAISSIPLPSICQMGEQHTFSSVPVWAMGDSPEREVPMPLRPFTVTCDGTRDVGWYRTANVFGYKTVEWPGTLRKVPFSGVAKVNKPLISNCDCLASVLRVGRFGRWQKGVLVHETYEATLAYLKVMNGSPS